MRALSTLFDSQHEHFQPSAGTAGRAGGLKPAAMKKTKGQQERRESKKSDRRI
jgi:hypothetical protein